MKNKTRILIYPFIIMGLCLSLTVGCKKEANNSNPTELEGSWKGIEIGGTSEIKNVTFTNNAMAYSSTGEWYNATLSINGTSYPKNMDVAISQCSFAPYNGLISLGIFTISNDTLYFANNVPGSGIRATSFIPTSNTRVFKFYK